MPLQKSDIIFKQVFPLDENVIALIEKLNQYQVGLYGRGKCTLDTPEVLIESKAFMIGAYDNEALVGIGAIKLFDDYAEIKRMYVKENYRGSRIAENILHKLETYAVKNEIGKVCLETGNRHYAALRFYKKMGYSEIARFGNYLPNDISVYLGKNIRPSSES